MLSAKEVKFCIEKLLNRNKTSTYISSGRLQYIHNAHLIYHTFALDYWYDLNLEREVKLMAQTRNHFPTGRKCCGIWCIQMLVYRKYIHTFVWYIFMHTFFWFFNKHKILHLIENIASHSSKKNSLNFTFKLHIHNNVN